ncbi:hypothetical protein BO78DRAFT_144105 [Aspergillus sclerotiicarbonarius CBS 121057]|uniref:Secreted protein n=1 Tax=Aspergillus sclerotiicarbonarius (strain CBS 121057 / IBT 28362) TaxID=1448318 RepID=A0A319EGM6_ASPSB|nr:hypothetical protein BO78DRAFT_144105 [Aspergillus sclerotiicarbonarius CBS 121057]
MGWLSCWLAGWLAGLLPGLASRATRCVFTPLDHRWTVAACPSSCLAWIFQGLAPRSRDARTWFPSASNVGGASLLYVITR